MISFVASFKDVEKLFLISASVDEGEVLVDGINVKDYSLEHLRNGVAMVLQKNTLFSGSIMENLRWGDENATDEEVYEMARYAQADAVFVHRTH